MQRVSSCQNKIKHSDSYKQFRQPQSVNLKTWAVFIFLAMINIKKCAIISPDQKTRRFLFLWSLFFLNFIIITTFYSCTSYLNICRSFECMYECDIKDLIRFGINYNKVRWNLGFSVLFFLLICSTQIYFTFQNIGVIFVLDLFFHKSYDMFSYNKTCHFYNTTMSFCETFTPKKQSEHL